VLGVRLEGELPAWVSAKDIILEMLRRHGVAGGVGKVVEHFGAPVSVVSRPILLQNCLEEQSEP
jgi:aconitate hydratase